VRIARLTRAPTIRESITGEYVWSGANWFFASKRPLLKINPGGLSEMGRAHKIDADLSEDDLRLILAAFDLDEELWRSYDPSKRQDRHLGDVRFASPELLEETAKKAGRPRLGGGDNLVNRLSSFFFRSCQVINAQNN